MIRGIAPRVVTGTVLVEMEMIDFSILRPDTARLKGVCIDLKPRQVGTSQHRGANRAKCACRSPRA